MPHRRPTQPPDLRETHFDNQRLSRVGIEAMTLAELRQRVSPTLLCVPERVDFHMLCLITAGRGRHGIDFSAHSLRRGSVMWVRPGQVQQWHLHSGLHGQLILAAPTALRATADGLQRWLGAPLDGGASVFSLSGDAREKISAQFDVVRDECQLADLSDLGIALVRASLTCLLLRLARVQLHARGTVPVEQRARAGHAELLRLLNQAVEDRLRERPTVQEISAALGYSVSSLNRACMAILGRSAKQVIDRRLALEAQRLLVHSPATAGQIGWHLGFSEPTNFLKFFRRTVGSTPEAFRQEYGGPR